MRKLTDADRAEIIRLYTTPLPDGTWMGVTTIAKQFGVAHSCIQDRLIRAGADKVTRALAAVPRYECHAVYHRQAAGWLEDYERELLAFPSGAHDDQVDCYSYAALALPTLQLVAVRQESMGETEMGGLMSQEL